MSDIIIRPLDIARDAEGLAEMWNASDLQWPGSWTEGLPITPEIVRTWERERRALAVYVAEADGKIVGYCSFMDGHHGHEGEGYLALLNVHPGYQKRSIGRRLIQATIERSVQEGWQRQTLGTWSANFKAVPTYKKTGHFWTPDTSVWMQNFIPGALQLSLAKPFFAKHDWYRCYVRELTQEEDDQRWEGLKVFRQHWEADGESLTIWIDREARAPVAIETDALQVAAIVADIEPLAGSTVELRWRVINKGAEDLPVYLHALGDKGLEIDHRDAFVVPQGQTVERLGQVRVAVDAPTRKEDGTAPAVRSILRLGDDEVELYSGLCARPPLTLDTAPAEITLSPGVSQAIDVQLHSEVDHPLEVTLHLTPPEGLNVGWRCRRVSLPAKGHVTAPLSLTCAEEGIYVLPIRLLPHDEALKPKSERISLFSLAAGGLLVQQEAKSARLESDAVRVSVAAKEGNIKLTHKDSRLMLVQASAGIGPPYYPSEFSNKGFELTVGERQGRATIHLAAEAKHYPGLWLHQEYGLSPSGLGVLCCYLENRGHETHSAHIQLGLRTSDREAERVALPLPAGVIHSRGRVYPVVWDDAPRDPAEYAEPWIAWERQGVAAGVAWDDTIAEIDAGWGLSLRSREFTLSPGARSPMVRFALPLASGNWRTVREMALRWAGRWRADDNVPSPRPPIWAQLEPRVLATVSKQVTATLQIGTACNRPIDGAVVMRHDRNLTIEPQEVTVSGLTRRTPRSQAVRMTLQEGAAGALRGELQVTHPFGEERSPFFVLRLGDQGPVTVSQGERQQQAVWTIDNGLCRFEVAPGFGPSLIAWIYEGQNQLYSAFPKPQGFSWLYPWFGGLHALLMPAEAHVWEGYLHRELFTATPLQAPDAAGLPWRGVRLSTRPEKKELHDLQVELDYLTVGHSKVFKYVYRLRNLRDAAQEVQTGNTLACRLGADPKGLVLRGEGLRRGATPRPLWAAEEDWGMLSNEVGPQAGRTMLLLSRQGDVLLEDGGQHGRVLGSSKRLRLARCETRELVYYLVLADSPDEAGEYLALRDYGA